MNVVENQDQEPSVALESEKRDKELEMTVQYAESNMKGLKHRTFNISCYVVILMLVLLFREVLREKYILPDTGWLGISAFLMSLLFIPVLLFQTVALFIQKNSKSAMLLLIEFVIWIMSAYFYFFVLR